MGEEERGGLVQEYPFYKIIPSHFSYRGTKEVAEGGRCSFANVRVHVRTSRRHQIHQKLPGSVLYHLSCIHLLPQCSPGLRKIK